MAAFKLPPHPLFPGFRCPKDILLLSSLPVQNPFSGKAKATTRALPLPILSSNPEEYFHDVSLWMNSGQEEHIIM